MYMSTGQLFNNNELIFSQSNDNGEFLSSGFKVESLFLNNNQSPMSSVGGGSISGNNISSLFKNLAVPAGLMFQKSNSHTGGKSWMKDDDKINLALDENYSPNSDIVASDIHANLTENVVLKNNSHGKNDAKKTKKRGGDKKKVSRKRK